MQKSIKYNYYNLIKIKPKTIVFYIIMIFTIIFAIYYLLFLEVYSHRDYYAISHDGCLYFIVTMQNSDITNNGKFIKIDGEKYEYQIVSIGELNDDEISNSYYQEYQIKVSKNFLENEVKVLSIYYKHKITFDKLLGIFT